MHTFTYQNRSKTENRIFRSFKKRLYVAFQRVILLCGAVKWIIPGNMKSWINFWTEYIVCKVQNFELNLNTTLNVLTSTFFIDRKTIFLINFKTSFKKLYQKVRLEKNKTRFSVKTRYSTIFHYEFASAWRWNFVLEKNFHSLTRCDRIWVLKRYNFFLNFTSNKC